ncbi:MAG: DNA repair protein RecO, partial [Alphaproteobacteria bacterium]|nr:DNA repair protein RecO [Alphaproteobacteria bacterium]
MQFVDEGYIVNLRKYGENSVIVTVVSKNHGLLTGFVKGGMSKKNLGVYQLGNLIRIDAYARIEENMLSFKTELIQPVAVNFMNNSQKLSALSAMCSLCVVCLQENENLERFYYYIDSFFQLINQENWLVHYAFFEFYLLEYLGIGLDLSECADTGKTDDLEYVSPKSGKAVCKESGEPYKERLFSYPHFIVDKNYNP